MAKITIVTLSFIFIFGLEALAMENLYINKEHKFQISLPSFKENEFGETTLAMFMGPVGDGFPLNIGVVKESNYSELDSYVKMIKAEKTVLESREIKQGDVVGYEMVVELEVPDYGFMNNTQGIQIYRAFAQDGYILVFLCSTSEKSYEATREKHMKILDSIIFLDK